MQVVTEMYPMTVRPPLAAFLRSNRMFKPFAADAHKSPEPPLTYPGAPPDSERAKRPPLPEPPYKPYGEKPALHEPLYEPYKNI